MSVYRIADLTLRLDFIRGPYGLDLLLPSFKPFLTTGDGDNHLLTMTIDDGLSPIARTELERIRDFDTGNGMTAVDEIKSGGYQFIVRDINGNDCCLLITNKEFTIFRCALNGTFNMRCFGLNNALMLAFAFAGAQKDTVLVHASTVRQGDYGYAFIAKSGTGKSTQVSMWLRYLPGCDLMNDDNPVIRIIDGQPFIYGSPWSGKTPCYRNVKAKLGAITRIDRSQSNSIERLIPIEAFASVLPSISSMKWEKSIYGKTCDTVAKLVETTGIYTLHCLPNKEAAVICNKAIRKK